MSRKYVVISVILPLLAIGLGIARAELMFARSNDFTFEIAGFDPRDLLRGHYLQFRLKLEPLATREACDSTSEDCCLCVMRDASSELARVEQASCTTARSCDAWLNRSYLSTALRYYVPESRASELERRLQVAMTRNGARAVMAIDRRGSAQVRELRIDGRPIPGAVTR